MARYTGPAYKKSRRLNFSTLENGKELAKKYCYSERRIREIAKKW